MNNLGIIAIGTYLPPDVRTNSWWPRSVVAGWRTAAANDNRPSGSALLVNHRLTDAGPGADSEGVRKVLAAFAASAHDPFGGCRQRRVLADGIPPSHMQIQAAENALDKAGLDPGDIDFIIEDSMVPDRLTVPGAPIVQHAIGAPQSALTLSTTAGGNAFATHVELAHALVRGGRYRYGLLIQGSALGRLIDPCAPYAPLFGDGATAVAVGPARDGFGFLASAHRTDGGLDDTMIAGVPGRSWYSDGPISWHPESVPATRAMLLTLADRARQIVGEALNAAGVGPRDVDFYASHQATSWFRQLTQEHAGLSHARAMDTFHFTGSLIGANVPFVLDAAVCDGQLRDGDLVVTHSGGTGITWSSVVLRWQSGCSHTS